MTPLPEPAGDGIRHPSRIFSTKFVSEQDAYTTEQMTKHEADGFRRGIEAAANLCGYLGQHSMATAIRKLGEKS